jgi:dihydroneopterin aldolase
MSKKPIMSHHVASAARRLRHVFVRDLTLDALIGIHEQEATTPQRIIVNIDLSVSEGEGLKDDDISHVVSYEIVVRKVEAILAEGHINLVETLCEKIAAACLRDRRVMAARVRVEKPDIIRNARSVGVEIERTRGAAGV